MSTRDAEGLKVLVEIQLCKVKDFFKIMLTKQGEKCALTQIMPFIEPHMHENNYSSKLL